MAGKGANRTGSIDPRGKNRWRIRWTTEPDPLTGERARRSITFEGTKTEARRRLAELIAEGHNSSDITLGALITRWREVKSHAPATAANYERSHKRIPRSLLETPVRKITAQHLDLVYRAMLDRGDSVHTVRQIHAVISGALTQACRWQVLRENPARWASPPAAERRQAESPTVEQLARLLEVARERDMQLAVWLRLSIVLGARRGEVLALRWSDVDLDRSTVTIRYALDPVTNDLKSTKTNRIRRVTIDEATKDLLIVWRLAIEDRAEHLGIELAPEPFIVSDDMDMRNPWRSDSGTRRFSKIRKAAGVSIRLHDIRHAAASHLLAAGMDIKTVSQRLGHTRTSTTADIYGHVLPASDQRSAEILGRIG